ncbi:MAG TPA: Asp-tRNA(Asn)/Glu-tRNA(Gln) amidotransferase GatCAB subunit B [Sutterella sp.]|nr:Asp-tRNA(Asn)/Glu-tRNA(Gln) amidotransferase GatCAB subunit B [Sutterella sp.]
MQWEVVIGLETHVQLSTKTKIFSGAEIKIGAEPNRQACPVDLALPGVLPVLNKGAVERAMRFGLAIGAEVAPKSVFARKNYFYPDLPKAYQISQFELPVVVGGSVTFPVTPKKGDPYVKTLHLTRAHLEEDAGKSVHGIRRGLSGIDLNRAGTPLLEIVTEPELRSAQEAVAYARALHALVVWLDISYGDMQNGNFRCDANVSVRPAGETKLGTRCEIKNLNSFKYLEDAINYEMRRQIELIEDGGTVIQATRLYDPEKGETREMRTKEDSMDYRYFPCPDLLPLEISREWLEDVRRAMPELPQALRKRLVEDFGLSDYDAAMVTQNRAMADYYLAVADLVSDKKIAANWVIGEVAATVNAKGIDFEHVPVTPAVLARVIERVLDSTISNKAAKTVFETLWESPVEDVDAVIERLGLKQISDASAIEKIVDEVIAANPKNVEEFKAGKEKALNALVGQVMKQTKGKANPAQVNAILRARLA